MRVFDVLCFGGGGGGEGGEGERKGGVGGGEEMGLRVTGRVCITL